MRKITTLSFLLFSIASLHCQIHEIHLLLRDSNVGASSYEWPDTFSNVSNDDGLNQIFQNHNVVVYLDPYSFQSEELQGIHNIVTCDGCDPQLLVQELNAYSEVVRFAVNSSEDIYVPKSLSVRLVDSNIGIYSNTENDVVITNDSGLNQLFLDFSVNLYVAPNGGVTPGGGVVNDYYELICDCDVEALRAELIQYSSVISQANRLDWTILLNTDEFKNNSLKIYPNPFKTKVNFESSVQLTSIELFDILGKRIYNSSDVSSFENYSETLKSGVYILKLVDQNKNTLTKKLIKN